MNLPGQSRAGPGADHNGFPQLFGKYVLVRPMARGGMGELFLAAAGERGFEKPCVVKKVLHNLSDAGVHRRFLDEAKVVVRLNHANLVQVFDAGRVHEEHFLAMELVEGKDLRAVWNRCAQLHRRIPVDIAMFVLREVLRGLDYVHDAMALDLVHRDISPPNVLVGYRGEIKLTDFGLAKSAIKREMTSPGVVFGRYSYLSPEQARGLPAERRTDIYACGIVLWELLTGRQLFPSGNRSHHEALAAVRNPSVRPPSELVPGIPTGLDDIVMTALAPDPANRYGSAGDFRAALSEILARDYPTCDADRTSAFMRDIFAREYRVEAREYADLAHQDFRHLRIAARDTEAISISDVIALESSPGPGTSTISLGESDIVELDRPGRMPSGTPTVAALRERAEGWVGRVVAQRYRIDHVLGVGGMGAVFRVTHLALGKPFALKVLHDMYTRDSDIIARFMREARAATQTGHPNIIDVIDIGTTEGNEVYFVMELLQGQNLATVLRQQGPMAIRRAVNIARQICRALGATHEVGIIHRDLKSENVMLTMRGKDPDFVKVLDFGICKHVDGDVSQTSPGLVMGSPEYMAPEQGTGLEATAASDIYAVGCILFEMLTGRLPFTGRNTVDVLMQKSSRDAVRATAYRPEIPEPLAEIIAACLHRAPSRRPPSMRALEYELTRAVDGRATAVAAILGLGPGDSLDSGQLGDDSGTVSGSGTDGAVPTSLPMAVVTGSAPRETTSSARLGGGPPNLGGQASRRPQQMVRRTHPAVAAVKAMLFVSLGGVLAAAAMYALRPDVFEHLLSAPVEPAKEGKGQAESGRAPAAPVDRSQRPVAGAASPGEAGAPHAGGHVGTDADVETSIKPVGTAAAGDSVAPPANGDVGAGVAGGSAADAVPRDGDGKPADAVGPDGALVQPDDPETLVRSAETAATAGHWREPAAGSLALALTNLAIVDPGNPQIAKLRQNAADILLPMGARSLERKRWSEAAAIFRDLVAVWPDHPEARAGLHEALGEQARVQGRLKDPAGVVATADELLNLDPGNFDVILLRADALMELKQFAEARDAYGAARKLKPRNRQVAKAYRIAAAQARRAADKP